MEKLGTDDVLDNVCMNCATDEEKAAGFKQVFGEGTKGFATLLAAVLTREGSDVVL